jgi:hypothetical protein
MEEEPRKKGQSGKVLLLLLLPLLSWLARSLDFHGEAALM